MNFLIKKRWGLFLCLLITGLNSKAFFGTKTVKFQLDPDNLAEIVPVISDYFNSAEGKAKIQEASKGAMAAYLTGQAEGTADALQAGSKADKHIQDIRNSTNRYMGEFLGDIQKQMLRMWPMLIGLPLVGYIAHKIVQLLFEQVKFLLMKPNVVISTNVGLKYRIKELCFGVDPIKKMVFHPNLEKRLMGIVKSTANINLRILRGDKKATYRCVLLYGPPGTGKTMFARILAQESGMMYAEVTGSSFFQKGAGITAINELFSWANNGQGLLIFIDEADSLFPQRDATSSADQERIQIINHFLNYLGTESNKYMIVVATNRPLAFDDALDRRFPDKVFMPLPDVGLRFEIMKHYRDTRLLDEDDNSSEDEAFKVSVRANLTDEKLREIAERTEGLSNGHLYYLIDGMKTRVISESIDGLLTNYVIDEIVNDQVDYYKKRLSGNLGF